MSISEHEANYTPSLWSKRFDQRQLLTHYQRFAENVTKNARNSFKYELDVVYGTTEGTKYDVYGTDLPDDAPIFVFIHGGYWQEGSKDIATFAVPVFVPKGIKIITVGYDLCPNVQLGDIVLQIKTAVEQILKSASSVGCRNVWISGHSAGAHLAISPLFDELWLDKNAKQGYLNSLKGFVLIGGVFNLRRIAATYINEVVKLTEDEIQMYSFTTVNVKNRSANRGLKVIVTVAECDSPGLIIESRECVQKLVTMVDKVEYIFLRDQIDHFSIVEYLTNEEFLLTKIILRSVLNE